MGDLTLAFFGVRYIVDEHDASFEELENGTDSRIRAAKRAKLNHWLGRLTDGGYYFLLIGSELGRFGLGASTERTVELDELNRIVDETQRKLAIAGIADTPALHFQLEAEY